MRVPTEPSVSELKSQFDGKVTPVREKAREISRDVDAAVQQIDTTRQDFSRNVESAKSRMRAAIDRAAALQQSVEPRVQARTRELQDAQPVAKANESYRDEMMRRRTRAGKLDKATKDAQLRPYLASIAKALEGDEPEHVRAARAYEVYLAAREKELKSPSFYIYSSRLFVAGEVDKRWAMRVITNCLELNVQDTQMFRSVAYMMLEIEAFDEAIALFRKVQDKAPAEPQSFIDLGLALFFYARALWRQSGRSDFAVELITESIDNLAEGILGKWMPRFHEIEWIIFVWLNWVVGYAAHVGLGDMWPHEKVERAFQVPNLTLDFVVAMGWDTDHTDVDLHVFEADGTHVYFGNRTSPNGGLNSRDFTDGYGPECYIIKEAPKGINRIRARYYASHQNSATTGSTSAVLWTVENFGNYDHERYAFQLIRLEVNQSELDVALIDLAELYR